MLKGSARSMPKARKRKRAKTPKLSAPLPPQTALEPTSSPSVDKLPVKRDRTILPSNSLVRQKVLAIISMRLEGRTNEDIAATLHIQESSIKQYMYLAGRNGWLARRAVDPTDRMEYEIAHKVVRNLDEMLDSDDTSRRDLATIKTAEGTLFKKFAEVTSVPPITMIGVRIEMPTTGARDSMREGTTGGEPLWKEGEIAPETP